MKKIYYCVVATFLNGKATETLLTEEQAEEKPPQKHSCIFGGESIILADYFDSYAEARRWQGELRGW